MIYGVVVVAVVIIITLLGWKGARNEVGEDKYTLLQVTLNKTLHDCREVCDTIKRIYHEKNIQHDSHKFIKAKGQYQLVNQLYMITQETAREYVQTIERGEQEFGRQCILELLDFDEYWIARDNDTILFDAICKYGFNSEKLAPLQFLVAFNMTVLKVLKGGEPLGFSKGIMGSYWEVAAYFGNVLRENNNK